jgi:hypothetical protein
MQIDRRRINLSRSEWTGNVGRIVADMTDFFVACFSLTCKTILFYAPLVKQQLIIN